MENRISNIWNISSCWATAAGGGGSRGEMGVKSESALGKCREGGCYKRCQWSAGRSWPCALGYYGYVVICSLLTSLASAAAAISASVVISSVVVLRGDVSSMLIASASTDTRNTRVTHDKRYPEPALGVGERGNCTVPLPYSAAPFLQRATSAAICYGKFVCPSVTLRYYVKTRICRRMRSLPSGSPVSLVF